MSRTKTETKHEAQDALMGAMQAEIGVAYERDDDPAVIERMIEQFRRVEKFLGYEAGSWPA